MTDKSFSSRSPSPDRSEVGRLEPRQVQPAGLLGRVNPRAAHVTLEALVWDKRRGQLDDEFYRRRFALPTVGDRLKVRSDSAMPLLETRIHQFILFRDRHQQPHSENVIVIKSPKPPLVLGPPPRLAYPLVVFLIRETEADEVSHPDDTVSCRARVRCTRKWDQTHLTMKAAKQRRDQRETDVVSSAFWTISKWAVPCC